MQTPKDAAALFEPPAPAASYSANYTNGPAHPGVDHLTIVLAAYADRQTALNSSGFTDRQFYWGHGNTSFSDLASQYGDGPAYQALGFQDGITFIDGTIVAYVSLLTADMSLDDANALVAQVASAEDALLQANVTPPGADPSSPSASTAAATPAALPQLPTATPVPLATPLPETGLNPPWGVWDVNLIPSPRAMLNLSNQGGVHAVLCGGGFDVRYTGTVEGTHVSLQGATVANPVAHIPSATASLQFDFGTDADNRIALKGTWSTAFSIGAMTNAPLVGTYNSKEQPFEQCPDGP
jgi:hypothetical protein